MNVRDLKYLVAVSETLHFGRAASRCFVSQPTLSGQIHKLEQELGVTLFERTNRSVNITPVGEHITAYARQVLEQVAAIHTLAQGHKDPLAGPLRVGAIHTLSPYLLPLFLPDGMTLDKLLRALIGVALFAGAYMAEVVRGGLQAVPRGQTEAARALGLGYWRIMLSVVLPQALRIVIPGIVNVFVALFKDTTLVLIIGLFDFLGIIKTALTNPEWLGYSIEGYVFAALVFWVFCFSMSRYSARLERRLGGVRRA